MENTGVSSGPQANEIPPKKYWVLTGASGFIGSHMVRFLSQKLLQAEQPSQITIVLILRNHDSDTSEFEEDENVRKVPIIIEYCPLQDSALMEVIFGKRRLGGSLRDGTQYIFHFAAQGGDWGALHTFVDSNERGTMNMVRMAERCKNLKKFVHMSTVDVYPRELEPVECHEGVPIVPDTRYGYSYCKARAEEIVLSSHAAVQLPVVILRPGVVLGAGSMSWGRVEAHFLRRGIGVLIGGGMSRCGGVDVQDLCRAAWLAALSDRAVGRVYNTTNPYAGPWRDFYDAVADAIGAKRVRFSIPRWLASFVASFLEFGHRLLRIEERPFLTHFLLRLIARHQDWPIEKAIKELDWKPEIPFKFTLQKHTEWLVDNPQLWE